MSIRLNKIFGYTIIVFIVLLCFSNSPDLYILNKNYFNQIQFVREFNQQFKILLLLSLILMMFFSDINFFLRGIKFNFFTKALLFLKFFAIFKYFFLGSIFGLLEFISFGLLVTLALYLTKRYTYVEIMYLMYISALVFLLINFIQIYIDFDIMFIKGRFVSITGNSNHAGVVLFCFLQGLLFMNNKKPRLIFKILICVFILFILLTGSRTALIGTGVFLILVTRTSIKSILFLISITYAGIYLLPHIIRSFQFDITSIFDRIKLDSNRKDIWLNFLNEFINNPLFGRTTLVDGRLNVIESSFLSALSNFGLIGFLIFFIGVIFVLRESISILKSSYYKFRLLASFNLSICIMGIAEGILLSNLAIAIFLLTINLEFLVNNKNLINLGQ